MRYTVFPAWTKYYKSYYLFYTLYLQSSSSANHYIICKYWPRILKLPDLLPHCPVVVSWWEVVGKRPVYTLSTVSQDLLSSLHLFFWFFLQETLRRQKVLSGSFTQTASIPSSSNHKWNVTLPEKPEFSVVSQDTRFTEAGVWTVMLTHLMSAVQQSVLLLFLWLTQQVNYSLAWFIIIINYCEMRNFLITLPAGKDIKY